MSVETVVRQNGTRKYRVRWREGGRNRARTFDRKRDAEAFDSELRRLRQAGGLEIFARGEQTLADYAAEWWERYAEPNLARRTLEVYSVQLDNRIIPKLGGYQLRQLSPAIVERFANELRRGDPPDIPPAGDPSVLKALTVLQAILKRAVIDGALRTNPVQAITKPRQRRSREPVVIRPEHVEAIRATLLAARRRRDATLVCLLAYAGPRPESEGVTIAWPQVRERTLLLRASKRNGAERTVPLLSPLAADLDGWAESEGRRGLVFPAEHGAWRDYDWKNWQRRVFKPVAVAVGLPGHVRARDLRGSLATLLIYEGRNISEVARIMGHSAETCLRDYLSVFEEFDPSQRTDAEAWIAQARASAVPAEYPAPSTATGKVPA